MTENLVERLAETRSLTDEQFRTLLTTDRWDADLFAAADRVRRAQYGTDVFISGLIEFTNYCKNNCYYCGIRHGNR
ncbi:MAG TPA: [FeFe] hydrogenase H-cluster radical SAM maturase HydE, partial [Candidatus Ruminococcus gallistercoris]|nr:[FeFe] hydrogenase H-cluster radical SAM maturase HydE [Candidatus Ruminococcus gallistercoris]